MNKDVCLIIAFHFFLTSHSCCLMNTVGYSQDMNKVCFFFLNGYSEFENLEIKDKTGWEFVFLRQK